MSKSEFIEFRVRIHECDCPHLFRLLDSKPTSATRNAAMRMAGELGARTMLATGSVEPPSGEGLGHPAQSAPATGDGADDLASDLLDSLGITPFGDSA